MPVVEAARLAHKAYGIVSYALKTTNRQRDFLFPSQSRNGVYGSSSVSPPARGRKVEIRTERLHQAQYRTLKQPVSNIACNCVFPTVLCISGVRCGAQLTMFAVSTQKESRETLARPRTADASESQNSIENVGGSSRIAEGLRGVPTIAERSRASTRANVLVKITPEEQRSHDEKAQVYSLIVMADCLDQAWLNRSISDEDYEKHCYDIIGRFNIASRAYRSNIPDIADFCKQYKCDAQNGYYHGFNRLVVSGKPATLEYARPNARDRREQQMHVSTSTASFITLMDAIAMDDDCVEDLLPKARDLASSLARVECVQQNYPFKEKLQEFIEKMSIMGVMERLTREDVKTFKLNLEIGYNEFRDRLADGR